MSTILAAFDPQIQASRNDGKAAMRELSPSLRTVIETRLSDRLERGTGRPLLGEYVPFMIAELLGVQNSKELQSIAAAWYQLVWGVVLLDDVIDNPQLPDSTNTILAASLLIQRSSCELLIRSANAKQMRQVINHAFERNVNAIVTEQHLHRGKSAEFHAHEVITLGDKLAVIDVCVQAIADLSHASERRDLLRDGFRTLVTCLQLLDDITDREEDWSSGNMTYLLTLAGVSPDQSVKYNGDLLLEQLIISGSLSRTLTDAENFLKAGLAVISDSATGQDSITVQYFRDLLHAIHDVRLDAVATQAVLGILPCHETNGRRRNRRIKYMQHRLTIVAQQS